MNLSMIFYYFLDKKIHTILFDVRITEKGFTPEKVSAHVSQAIVNKAGSLQLTNIRTKNI